ncbi:MAG: class I SAM-dependent RNA methyltransferase [Rhizobiaceae bacterium]|nr:class I SAM-dependent RNA methyltransferase [Rhizobiaceae bacterium]
MAESVVTIDRLGAQGDGVADTSAGPLFVPFALPGERVNVARSKDRGEIVALLESSPQRIEPACRHFGDCGGCAIQHLEDAAYRDWKRGKVVEALRARGIDAPVADLVPCAPGSRRRVTYSARRTQAGILLGYHAAMSDRIVDIAEDPITVPAIVERLDDLRRLAGALATGSEPFRLAVTATQSGLDIQATGLPKLTQPVRLAAADLAARAGFARLSLEGDILVEPRKPRVTFGSVTVEPPPGAFLQATAQAEAAMAGLVLGHLGRVKRVADLFSGCGTFALRLAAAAEVHAAESDAAALAALDRGFRSAGGALRRVTTEKRDLFRRPLAAAELDRFDGVVFDPPRAGAEDQSKQIAKSAVPLVAAVSCNPGTLARDLAILTAGGYRLTQVVPIDQFLWSPHVEAVALLEKPRKRR